MRISVSPIPLSSSQIPLNLNHSKTAAGVELCDYYLGEATTPSELQAHGLAPALRWPGHCSVGHKDVTSNENS